MPAGSKPGRHNLIKMTSAQTQESEVPLDMVPSGSDIEQRHAEVKLAWTPSIHAPCFSFLLVLSWPSLQTPFFVLFQMLSLTPQAIRLHCEQHILFASSPVLSVLSHSFRTVRHVSAEKEWGGQSSGGYFTPTGNVNKVFLGTAIGKKTTVEVGCCICKISQPLSLSRPQTKGNLFQMAR